MGIQIGGFGTGFLSGLTSGANLAKQYQDSQTAKAKQKFAGQMADYVKKMTGGQGTPAPATPVGTPATTQPVDVSPPPQATVLPEAPTPVPAALDASASPSLMDVGGTGLNYLEG